MVPDKHAGKNSWFQCKLHGLGAEGKGTEKMKFQDWELGKQVMDVGILRNRKRSRSIARSWRWKYEGISWEDIWAGASGLVEKDG